MRKIMTHFDRAVAKVKESQSSLEIHYILGFRFVRTSFACPEQYDVFDAEGDKVGFVNLQNGLLTVWDDDPSQGIKLFASNPEGAEGIFTSTAQRDKYLRIAAIQIEKF